MSMVDAYNRFMAAHYGPDTPPGDDEDLDDDALDDIGFPRSTVGQTQGARLGTVWIDEVAQFPNDEAD